MSDTSLTGVRLRVAPSNPYLTFAALLHAGLEGIERGYELEAPMDSNLYHLTAEERRERGIVSLPETLGEAIDEFAQSDLLRRAFGDHIFDNYVKLKRKEWDDYRVQLRRGSSTAIRPCLTGGDHGKSFSASAAHLA